MCIRDRNVTSTGASSANILEVADGNAQMSILQSDVLSYAHSGTDLFTEAETCLLYTSYR